MCNNNLYKTICVVTGSLQSKERCCFSRPRPSTVDSSDNWYDIDLVRNSIKEGGEVEVGCKAANKCADRLKNSTNWMCKVLAEPLADVS